MPAPHGTITSTHDEATKDFVALLFPNPASNSILLDLNAYKNTDIEILLADLEG